MNAFYLSELYIYPIKSLGGFSIQESLIEERGLEHDRRWMLIDEQGTFISQRTHFELALLQVNLANGRFTVSHKSNPEQQVSFHPDEYIGDDIMVTIWDDVSSGKEVNETVSKWFSDFMSLPVRLVKMLAHEKRFVDPRYAANAEIVSFADAYPCLIIGQSSLNHLNEKLADPILMDRFRPNFVFAGGDPHVEDQFGTFYLGDVLFSAVKPCARCVLITIDQQTGTSGKEPLKTLARYRTMGKKILFGQNLIHKGAGTIRVGEALRVQTWKA